VPTTEGVIVFEARVTLLSCYEAKAKKMNITFRAVSLHRLWSLHI